MPTEIVCSHEHYQNRDKVKSDIKAQLKFIDIHDFHVEFVLEGSIEVSIYQPNSYIMTFLRQNDKGEYYVDLEAAVVYETSEKPMTKSDWIKYKSCSKREFYEIIRILINDHNLELCGWSIEQLYKKYKGDKNA